MVISCRLKVVFDKFILSSREPIGLAKHRVPTPSNCPGGWEFYYLCATAQKITLKKTLHKTLQRTIQRSLK